MPQMMPCSWMLIFLGSMMIFLVINSSWGSFFFLSSFPVSESSSSRKKVIFWI